MFLTASQMTGVSEREHQSKVPACKQPPRQVPQQDTGSARGDTGTPGPPPTPTHSPPLPGCGTWTSHWPLRGAAGAALLTVPSSGGQELCRLGWRLGGTKTTDPGPAPRAAHSLQPQRPHLQTAGVRADARPSPWNPHPKSRPGHVWGAPIWDRGGRPPAASPEPGPRRPGAGRARPRTCTWEPRSCCPRVKTGQESRLG